MAQDGPNPGSPHDLIRVGITLSALLLALVSFVLSRDRVELDDKIVALFIAAIGLLAFMGTMFAVAALWQQAGLEKRHLRGIFDQDSDRTFDYRHHSLVLLTWAMIGLIIAFVAVLVILSR